MNRILVIKYRALGDAIIGLATIHYLQEIFPKAKITYALPKWITPLFQNAELNNVEVVPIQLNNIFNLLRLYKTCSQLNPDCIFELQQRGSTGKFFKFFSRLKNIKYYFHNHHIKTPGFVLDQGINKPIIQRDLDGIWSGLNDLYPNQYAIPDFLDYEPELKLKGVVKKENSIIIGVVATRETKMWPIHYYVSLIKLILKTGKAEKIVIPISNSDQDAEIERQLKALSLPTEAKIIKLPLDQLPLELAKSRIYIGNDTGLKHICISLGLKTYTFFGPEPPKEWHPYDTSKHFLFYREGLECRTIKKHYCDLSRCDSMICLNQITPESVYNRIFKME